MTCSADLLTSLESGVERGGDLNSLGQNRLNSGWRPGLAAQQAPPCFSELFASASEAAGAGAALALALDDWRSGAGHAQQNELAETQDRRSILWVQTEDAARLSGRPFRAGLPAELRERVIYACAKSCADALFALEEGIRCRDMGFVIGEVAGNHRALDFTASRRLTLAAQSHGVPLYLVRLNAQADLSSARMRWNVRSALSPQPYWNAAAPGMPSWQAELFRARGYPVGEWILRSDEEQGALQAEKPADRAGMRGGNQGDRAEAGPVTPAFNKPLKLPFRPTVRAALRNRRKASMSAANDSGAGWAAGLQNRRLAYAE
jgi:protein ImuA